MERAFLFDEIEDYLENMRGCYSKKRGSSESSSSSANEANFFISIISTRINLFLQIDSEDIFLI